MKSSFQEKKKRIDRLEREHCLTLEDYAFLLRERDEESTAYLRERADAVRRAVFGPEVYLRGLIEFTNVCRNDCLYCGLRRSNGKIERYRLSEEEILSCCSTGYALGYRTFVLQGGEDPSFSPERIAALVRAIKEQFPEAAVTLSVGEHPYETYALWKRAGADRYFLRHETANEAHYRLLHPEEMSLAHRKQCLYDLKVLGYQVGCGFMVGSPGQTEEALAEDLLFLTELEPEMVGIGPFLPQHDTPFREEPKGSAEETLFLLGMIRLLLPEALLPATTALGTLHPEGRELGLRFGANVLMPNLSPRETREKYAIYDNKICTGDEAAECRECLARRVEGAGYFIAEGRGDHRRFLKEEAKAP